MSAERITLDNLPDVLYVKEIAALLRTTDKAVRHKIDRGHIRAVKIGGRILVTKQEVKRLLGLDGFESTPKTAHTKAPWREKAMARGWRS